jgi:hypothetical protein
MPRQAKPTAQRGVAPCTTAGGNQKRFHRERFLFFKGRKQMHTYTNPFHSPQYQGSKQIITTNAAPEEYKGHLIFKIHKAHFDVVQNGALVTQMSGLGGARAAVDRRQPYAGH